MALTLHTSHGDIKLELHCDLVQDTCHNFLALCASDAYNNTKFHRSIKGFMIQGGDPTGTGKGGRSIFETPSGRFKDEFVPSLTHDGPGVVSMANSGPDTNGSQFFLTYAAQPHLDGRYTVFGRVIDGMEVLQAMEKVPVDADDRPVRDIVLRSVTIHANPLADTAVV